MKITTRDVVIVSVAAGLSTALSFLRLFELPQGGSVTLELIPVFYIAYKRGAGSGIAAGLLSGTIQLILRPFVVHPVQLLLDYPLAMAGAGVAGYFRHVRAMDHARTAVTIGSGVLVVVVAAVGWGRLDAAGRLDRAVLSNVGNTRVEVVFRPDTVLGDVEARMVTLRSDPDGRTDTLATLTAHGDRARLWLTQALQRQRLELARGLGAMAVGLALIGGVALILARLNVGVVSIGVLAGSGIVFTLHFISGLVFFGQYAPPGQSVWVYSAVYNAGYVAPQALLSLVVLPPLLRRSADVRDEPEGAS